MCGVWMGDKWKQFDRSEFGGLSAHVIKEAPDRRIWFDSEDGIYIK